MLLRVLSVGVGSCLVLHRCCILASIVLPRLREEDLEKLQTQIEAKVRANRIKGLERLLQDTKKSLPMKKQDSNSPASKPSTPGVGRPSGGATAPGGQSSTADPGKGPGDGSGTVAQGGKGKADGKQKEGTDKLPDGGATLAAAANTASSAGSTKATSGNSASGASHYLTRNERSLHL